jgi:sterol desaturase/sphingolipid hydroxylase (fatty acid hydroxylase superfamily)
MTIYSLLIVMAVVAAVEALLPLRAHAGWNRAHLTANLALTFVTFATNALLSAALVALFTALESAQLGLLHALPLGPAARTGVAVLALDLAFYAFHVSMHKSDALWRFHRVHHCDPALDVSSAFRQHPGEGVVRAAFHAAFGAVFGVAPAAYALYRSLSALAAIAEHANVRLPRLVDDALSLVVTFPNLHKVHHARERRLHDTNFGNVICWWDRLFGTFTSAREGARVDYGLDGFDQPAVQGVRGLLALPFRDPTPAGDEPLLAVRPRPDHA